MEKKSFSPDKLCTFFSPLKILLEAGATARTGIEARRLGAKKALIVTDPGIIAAGLVDPVRASLLGEKIEVSVFDGVEPEPPARVMDRAGQAARAGGVDVIIGLGGGSSLDTAKGASILGTNEGGVLDYAGHDMVPTRGLPKVLLPTSASGSEVTRVFAPTDEKDGTKKVIYTPFNLAEVVIVDPLLGMSMPPEMTAETGIDGMVAAIESYVCVNESPFSDLLALEAIRLASQSLPIAFAKADHLSARLDLCLSAVLANLAWQSGGLGAVHGLTYVLETECGLKHARASSVMLPHVMEYNLVGALGRYASVAEAMGENVSGLSPFDAADRAVFAVRRLLRAVGISDRLSDYGVTKEHLPRLVAGAMKQARLFVPNPRNLTEEDVEKIYLNALG
jgi:alcohol dehydrogenase class IV